MPAVGLLVAFHFVPVGAGSYYAFTKWNGFGHPRWVGLHNFRSIAHDPTERGALWHTVELAFSFVVLVNMVGLALALGLNRTIKTRRFLRLVFFAPVVLSPLAIAFIWRWIFDADGALNRTLGAVGLASLQRAWLGDPSTALWTILVVLIWQFSGLALVLYLAGLQGISDEIYDAAAVDGAGGASLLWKIVMPLLAPAVTTSATLTLIVGLRVFEQPMALTQGGPVTATETLATQVYKQTFFYGRYGYGTALALVLTALVGVVALAQLAILRRNENSL